MAVTGEPTGPNLAAGLPTGEIAEGGWVAGHVDGEPVLLSRLDGGWFAVGGACTHYGGALGDGLVAGETVRCPLHHACFSRRTGEALAAPAFDPLGVWRVEVQGDRVFVRARADTPAPSRPAGRSERLRRIVIVGGGAAGFAAAEMLRRRGYDGSLIMLSADEAPPCDRPNLSKDYLAGTAPEDWIPLKGDDFYRDNAIDLRLGARVARIADADEVVMADGGRLGFDALLLATGAEPVRLKGSGFDAPNVHTLRSLADARAIIAAAADRPRAVVIGASFIGLEVAASLRARGLEVAVAAPEAVPMERVLGRELGEFVRGLHEAQGVTFHLGEGAESYADGRLRLSGGTELEAGLVVLGVGVRPRAELAEAAGIAVDNGILVDARLRTSRAAVFAAGDVARYPDPLTGEPIRVEHWVAAERQGQAAARSMLGEDAPFAATPFFWSNHYGTEIRYVGHGARFDAVEVTGSTTAGDVAVRYLRAGRLVAAATIGRDLENLTIGADLERALSSPV